MSRLKILIIPLSIFASATAYSLRPKKRGAQAARAAAIPAGEAATEGKARTLQPPTVQTVKMELQAATA